MADQREAVEMAGSIVQCCPGASTCAACAASVATLAHAVIALDEEVRRLWGVMADLRGTLSVANEFRQDVGGGSDWFADKLYDGMEAIDACLAGSPPSRGYQVGDARHVELWDAINDVVAASGGKSTTGVARQHAVSRVERALESLATRIAPPAPSSPGASEVSGEDVERLPVDTCRVCGTPRVFTNGRYMDHRAPCGRMCRTAEGYPGQVHPDHCDCPKREAIRLGADADKAGQP